jgi:hypothetical protein
VDLEVTHQVALVVEVVLRVFGLYQYHQELIQFLLVVQVEVHHLQM